MPHRCPAASDAEVVARYTSNDYRNDDGHLLFRYSGAASSYAVGLDSPMGLPELNIMRTSGGTKSRVANIAFPAVNGTAYWERARIQTSGSSATILVRAWPDGTPEPATWNLTYTDPSPLPAGMVGMEAWDSGAGWKVDSFSATALGPVSSPPPPSPGPTPTPTPSPTPGSNPSGQAMPVGDISGWSEVFSDDFSGNSINTAAWGSGYTGQPGGDPGGCWDPSHVVVSAGMLHLETFQDSAAKSRQGCSSNWVSGGVSSARALSQTYGKYLVRMRADVGHGVSAIALLWPSVVNWPPEIDFYEDGSGNRVDMAATLHCGSNGNDSCQIQKMLTMDFSQWHTLGVEWSPGVLNYTVDGTIWATVTNSSAGNVPATPMEFDLQTQAGTCGDQFAPCPDSTTPSLVDYQIDWVVAYKPGP